MKWKSSGRKKRKQGKKRNNLQLSPRRRKSVGGERKEGNDEDGGVDLSLPGRGEKGKPVRKEWLEEKNDWWNERKRKKGEKRRKASRVVMSQEEGDKEDRLPLWRLRQVRKDGNHCSSVPG